MKSDDAAPVLVTAALYLDGRAVSTTAEGTLSGSNVDWKLVGGVKTVGNSDMHTIIVQITLLQAMTGRSVTIAFDELSCIPAVNECTSASAPAPS